MIESMPRAFARVGDSPFVACCSYSQLTIVVLSHPYLQEIPVVLLLKLCVHTKLKNWSNAAYAASLLSALVSANSANFSTPQQVTVLRVSAYVCLQQANYAKAASFITKLLETAPNDPYGLSLLVRLKLFGPC